MQADDLAPALGVDGHGDYCGNADDPPAFAYLEIGGIEPEIRPFAGERAFQKGMDALVNVLAKLGDGGLGDAGHAQGLVDRKSDVWGKRVSVRVGRGGSLLIKKKIKMIIN